MAIVQDAFDIPDDINSGIATGLYRRIGGVVRYANGPKKGQIVKLLDPIDLKVSEEAQGLIMKLPQVVKQVMAGAVVGTLVLGACIWGYNKFKPRVVTEFRAALKAYIDAIREGNMDINKIDKLMAALEELKKHKDYEKISIQLTAEELGVLVDHIYKYTVRLAMDNDIELPAEELNTAEMKNSGIIINLQNYLKAQKKIFEATA